MLEVRSFGTLSIRDTVDEADVAAILSRPKRAALLAYLACARPHGSRRRDELFGLFWPELPQRNARKALNQSVYVLRSLIGYDIITSRRGEEIGLDRSAVWSDTVSFSTALARGELPKALDLYRGELLTAFHLPGCLPFERWLDGEREHYHRQAIDAALSLAAVRQADGDAAGACERLRWALRQSPYDEAVLVRLLRLMTAIGDDASARRELERFAERFDAELGLQVSAETRALVPHVPQLPAREPVGKAEPAFNGSDHPPDANPGQTGSLPAPAVAEPGRSRHGATSSGRRRAVGIAIAAGLIGITLFQARRSGGSSGPARMDAVRVHVAPLENLTGAAELNPLGRIAADWVARGLLRTGLVGVVPTGSAADVDVSSGAGNVMTLVFSGAFHREAERVVLEARFTDAGTGAVVRVLQSIVAEETEPLAGLERLRQHATGALATLVDPRFADWADDASQPPSFDAYLDYVAGMERLERGDYAGAGERFLAAAARDSSFTSASLWAIQSYSLVGAGPRDSLALALEASRDRLPAWDRAMLDFHLADLRLDNYGAYRAMQRIVALSPTPQWRVLLAEQARRINRQAEALQLLDGIEPERVTGIPGSLPWIVIGNTYHAVGRFDDELAHARRWAARSPDMAHRFELAALAGLGRGDDVVRRVLEMSRDWNWNHDRAETLRRTALELRAHGQMEHARAVLDRSFALYGLADDSTRQDPESRFIIGRSLYAADRWEESRALFTRLLDEGYRTAVVRGDIGLAAARLGDREAAEVMIDWFTAWAAGQPRQGGWATQWRARIAAALGDRDQAVGWLRQAFDEGWSFTVWDHRNEEYENLRGYQPFEELMRPRG